MTRRAMVIWAALSTITGRGACGDDLASANSKAHAVAGTAAVNGTTIYYKISGTDARQPPVLFLHGLALDSRMWDPQIEILANFRKTIQADLRGHGRSGGIFAPTLLHDDVVALLDSLNVDSVDVVGLSLGGKTALDLVLTRPERVRSLTLIDSDLGGYPYDSSHPDDFIVRLFGYIDLANTVSLRAGLEGWLNDPLFAVSRQDPDTFRALQEMILGNEQQGNGSGFKHLMLIIPNFQQVDQVSRIKVPTLVLVGEHDGAEFKDIARVLATRIPGAKSYVIPRADHMSNMVQAQVVVSHLIRFWATVGHPE